MIGKISCGCVYLRVNGMTRQLEDCRGEDRHGVWIGNDCSAFEEGKQTLTALTTEQSNALLTKLAELVRDGYAARELKAALGRVMG